MKKVLGMLFCLPWQFFRVRFHVGGMETGGNIKRGKSKNFIEEEGKKGKRTPREELKRSFEYDLAVELDTQLHNNTLAIKD